jgi:hypothetical protein
MKRVAVVGAGDSGKTAIEALMGQGPSTGRSVAALDHPERVDWYGVPETCMFKGRWLESSRSRYAGIARNLPVGKGNIDRNNPPRLKPTTERAGQVVDSYDGVLINGRRYDHVIWCTGSDDGVDEASYPAVNVDNRTVAAMPQYRVYRVGPAANIAMDNYETAALPANLPENQVALFRYAERTATFAANIERFEKEGV